MVKVRADTLTFTLPEWWDEITTGQALAIFASTSPRSLITTLSGKSEAELGPLRAPDLGDLIASRMAFILTPPDFNSMTPPSTLTIGDRTVEPPTNLGTQTTIAQKWEADDLLSKYDAESLSLFEVAPDLLAIYLYPMLTGKAYTDIELARAELPAILETPCTESLPLAAFFLTSLLAPINSGRVSFSPIPVVTVRTRAWLPNLRLALTRLIPTSRFGSWRRLRV